MQNFKYISRSRRFHKISVALLCNSVRIHFMKITIKKSFIAPLTGLALCISACSPASSADEAKSTAALVEVGNWDIQPESSHIKFSALQEGKTFTGEFQEFSGIINFDPAAPENGLVRIEIPLKSVEAGSNDRNSTLPEKVWFSTKAHPTAIYTSSDISAQGDGFLAKGELTLKGMSVPFNLPFNLTLEADTAVMTSTVEMDRTKWNVGAAPWDTDEWVSRTVKLDLQVTAQKIQ